MILSFKNAAHMLQWLYEVKGDQVMVKSYSQKLRVLYVMQILLRNSDEEHPISQAEISERLNAYGIQADRKKKCICAEMEKPTKSARGG